MQVVDSKNFIEKFNRDSKVFNKIFTFQEFHFKCIQNFRPVNGKENFEKMKNKIIQLLDNEISAFLNNNSEFIFKRLLFVVYDIINENFILKNKNEKEINFDFDEFIRNILYSLCNLVLKVTHFSLNFNIY